MSEKIKYELEFEIKSSAPVLFNMIATPSGLSEWFADDVNIKDDAYSFFWDGSPEEAELLSRTKGKSIRFQWKEHEREGLNTYFELLIRVDALTNDVALIITDFADEDEMEEAKLLWENQIADLRMIIGA